jgi:hypothetical protein
MMKLTIAEKKISQKPSHTYLILSHACIKIVEESRVQGTRLKA